MINAFRTIAREEGFRVFYSGLGATCLRAFPTNAATFYVVGAVQNALEQKLL
jgi:solute carrier family 25 carnitine/acylcarnitine transporter 20/29